MFDLDLKFCLTTFILVFLLTFLRYSLKIYHLRQKYKHIPGPPANGILGFYLGNYLEIREYQSKDKLVMDKVLEWYTSYFENLLY